MAKKIDSKIPAGPVPEKWKEYKAHQRLVNPKNKLKLDVIVVGTGLAGASAAASLAEMGFNVYNFCIQDSPRRAHSIAAQGGTNDNHVELQLVLRIHKTLMSLIFLPFLRYWTCGNLRINFLCHNT